MRRPSSLRSYAFPLAALSLLAAVPFAACSSTPTTSPQGSAGDTSSTTGSGGKGGGGAGGKAGTGPGGNAGSGGAAAGAIEARFTLPASGLPGFLDVPFPTDLYLDTKGHVGDVPNLTSYVKFGSPFLLAGLAPLDGFGTTAGALFALDDFTKSSTNPSAAAIDPASLPASEADSTGAKATAMIVDLDAAGAATALVPARADYHDDTPFGGNARPVLAVWPARGIVLAEHHHYAVVLTTGIQTLDKKPLGPSPTFQAIRDGKQRGTAAEMLYGAAVDKVATLVPALKDKTKIAVVAVYSTQGMTHELTDLRGQFLKLPPPALAWDAPTLAPMGKGLFSSVKPLPAGYTASLDDWLGTPAKLLDGSDDPAHDQVTGAAHDQLAAVGTAVFNAPNVLVVSPMGYADPTHNTFARDASGAPRINPAQPTNKIWMTVALPKGTVPASGFPTVVLQHGLGQERSLILALADTFAKKGWATVAIEIVTFGARAAEAANTIDAASTFPWSGTAAYNGPDGFVDVANGSTDFFGNLKSLGAVRDQMRQSVLDIESAVDVIRNPALDLGPLLLAVPGAKLDPTRLAYVGNSLGGLTGAMVAATDPHLSTFVLNVAGGGLMTELGAYSPDISSSLATAATLNFGFSKAHFSPSHPIVQLLQHVVDPGDPLLFAQSISLHPLSINGTANAPKNVIQIEAYWDEIVPNESNEALARAAGFPMAAPFLGSNAGVPLTSAMGVAGVISGVPVAGATAVLLQAGPATHADDLYSAIGSHSYMIPYAQFDTATPFTKLPMPVAVAEPYLALQAVMTGFFASAFAGGGAPSVSNIPVPTKAFK